MSVRRLPTPEPSVDDRLAAIEGRLTELADLLHKRPGVAYLEPWLTLEELAEAVGCSKRYLDPHAQKMPHRMIGNKRKFRVSEAEQWLRRHKVIKEVSGAAR